MGGNVHTIKENAEALVIASKETGLEVLIKLRTWSHLEIRMQEEVTGKWRKLHNEKLNDLHSSTNFIPVIKSRRIRWGRNVIRMGKRRDGYRVYVGKPEGEIPLGRPRH